MKIKTLIKPIKDVASVWGSKEVDVTSITAHSQAVGPGSLFIAKRGRRFDGNDYAQEAALAGAAAIMSDMYNPLLKNIVQIIVPDMRAAEPLMARQFYGDPSDDMMVFGVTGTSGKTTTAYLLRHFLEKVGMPSGMVGTVSYIVGSAEIQASRTTPDVLFNHKVLRDMRDAGQKACVMEVTSHALDQGRVAGIDFDRAVFTNLSHEHLDYHTSMEEYARAKSLLFGSLGRGRKRDTLGIANAQDLYFEKIVRACSAPIYRYAIEGQGELIAQNVCLSAMGARFDVVYRGRAYPVVSPLPGRFNIMNTLASFGTLLTMDVPMEELLQALISFQAPPGRLEPVSNKLGLSVFVDYAHKEDALRKVLVALRECTEGELIVVFGCGGERDREKRPLMARAVEELADRAVVTTDNPRSEDPEAILQEIVAGFSLNRHIISLDRREAIEVALRSAGPKDTVVIAGKGHEREQIFRHRVIPFDDKKIAGEICDMLFREHNEK